MKEQQLNTLLKFVEKVFVEMKNGKDFRIQQRYYPFGLPVDEDSVDVGKHTSPGWLVVADWKEETKDTFHHKECSFFLKNDAGMKVDKVK